MTPQAGVATPVNPIVEATWYLFVASIPFSVPHEALPAEVPTLTAALFLVATLLHPSVCFQRVPPAMLWFTASLWVLGLAAVVNWLEYAAMALQLGLWFVQAILVFWTGTNLLRHERVRRRTLLALVAACAALAGMEVLGIFVTTHKEWGGGVRITVFGQNPNLVAMILSAGLAALIGLTYGSDGSRRSLRWLAWPVAALIGAAIIETGSRGGLLCAVAAMLPLVLRGETRQQRLRHALVGVAAVALLAWGGLRSDTMRGRFERSLGEGNLAGREQIYPAGLEMVRERPWLGWGPIDNQAELARRIKERALQVRELHNLVLELLTAGGILATLPFLIGMGLCFRAAWRARRGPGGVVALALLAAVFVGTMSGSWLVAKILWLALTFAAASDPALAWRDVPVALREQPCAV